MKSDRPNAGYALVTVMCLTAAMIILLAGIMLYSSSEMRIATDQANMETALYVAQAGAEQGAAFVANGGTGPTNFYGTNAGGTFVVAIIPASLPSSAPRTVGGWVDLSPGGTVGDFVLRNLDDGTLITSSTLVPSYQGYTGSADWVHFRSGGSGNQTSLLLDGAPYQVLNSATYDTFASCMSVYLYNDSIDTSSNAVGHWKISFVTTCASFIVSN